MTLPEKARAFAVQAHGAQMYGPEKPYAYHLDKVVAILTEFGFGDDEVILAAGYLHDVLEDTSVTEQDLQKAFSLSVINCVYAVTDRPGKNRKERHDATYPFIARSRSATAVKLADRIANATECLVNDYPKLEVYRKEYPHFRNALRKPVSDLADMWRLLDILCGFKNGDQSA